MTPHVPESVRALAAQVHASQIYNGGPYTQHLEQVADIVWEVAPDDDDLVVAAYLHDVLEDGRAANVTANDLRGFSGVTERVVKLVEAVTRAPGTRRKTIPAALERTRAAGEDAILIKLADRIANVDSCWTHRDTRLFMYWREYTEFRAVLFSDTHTRLKPLWDHLDRALDWRGLR